MQGSTDPGTAPASQEHRQLLEAPEEIQVLSKEG